MRRNAPLRLLIKNKFPKFGMNDKKTDAIAKDIVDLLVGKGFDVKNTQKSLEATEFDVLFDTLTKILNFEKVQKSLFIEREGGLQGSAAGGGVKRPKKLGRHLRLRKQRAAQMLSANPDRRFKSGSRNQKERLGISGYQVFFCLFFRFRSRRNDWDLDRTRQIFLVGISSVEKAFFCFSVGLPSARTDRMDNKMGMVSACTVI